MSWHCSRALVAEFSAGTSWDGEPSAPLNSTPTPDQYYWPDKTTEHSRLSRFGMTCVPLMADRGAALLTWFQEVSRARTSAQPEKATGLTGSEVGSGRKWLGLLARFDRDSLSWRTPQCSLVEGLDEFSETWPRWGSMRNGESYQRETPAHLTSESESGLWPTPNCIGFRSDGELKLLAESAKDRVEFLGMSFRACNSKRERFWPTATAYKGWSKNHNRALTDDRLDYTVEREAAEAGAVGRLNPDWVEWLMGWPTGLTELKPLAMGRFQEWQQQHGNF